jgi:hypothetical protein
MATLAAGGYGPIMATLAAGGYGPIMATEADNGVATTASTTTASKMSKARTVPLIFDELGITGLSLW